MGTQGRNFDCSIENPLAGFEYFYLDKKYQLNSFFPGKTLLMWAKGIQKNSGSNSRLKCRNPVGNVLTRLKKSA